MGEKKKKKSVKNLSWIMKCVSKMMLPPPLTLTKKKKNDDIKVLFHLVTPSYQNQVS